MSQENFVETITEYIDAFLTKQAGELAVEKKQLSVFMSVKQQTLTNKLILDGAKWIGWASIKDVVGAILAMVAGAQIERKIIEGFHQYAKETQRVCEMLKLGLYYNSQGKLVYQVYYENNPIQVDLTEFFKK